jgi:hypothetical protein
MPNNGRMITIKVKVPDGDFCCNNDHTCPFLFDDQYCLYQGLKDGTNNFYEEVYWDDDDNIKKHSGCPNLLTNCANRS